MGRKHNLSKLLQIQKHVFFYVTSQDLNIFVCFGSNPAAIQSPRMALFLPSAACGSAAEVLGHHNLWAKAHLCQVELFHTLQPGGWCIQKNHFEITPSCPSAARSCKYNPESDRGVRIDDWAVWWGRLTKWDLFFSVWSHTRRCFMAARPRRFVKWIRLIFL